MSRPARSTFGEVVGGIPPAMLAIIVANLALWFLHAATAKSLAWNWVTLDAHGLFREGHVWELLTYQFVHDPRGPFHLIFNMLGLWFFGRELEWRWGGAAFVRFYLLCGVGAGLLQALFELILGSNSAVMGASGSVLGVMVAFAMIWPRRLITFFFLLTLQARHAVLIIAALEVLLAWSGMFGAGSRVANVAHLGGMLTGWLYLKYGPRLFALPRGLRQRLDDWKRARLRKRMRVVDPDWEQWLRDNDDTSTKH